ncbi:MAG: dihydropteroate synthase [Cryomorphaceae bacterium]|nr:dihydropteroate synthase [Cryomorphaceae bacterium]
MTWNFRSRETLHSIALPFAMGIINATPDSFFSSSRHLDVSSVLRSAERMVEDGAVILDIGGQSTRPGSERVTADEELVRVQSAISAIRKEFPDVLISVDTYSSVVLQAGIEAGADMANDISAGSMDQDYLAMVARLQIPYILMHMQGSPETMHMTVDDGDMVKKVFSFFSEKLAVLRLMGISDIVLDPGFGFGKTIEQNYHLLSRFNDFKAFNCPLLAGISRKGMLQKPLGITADKALNATTVANVIASERGADILRVHDVKEAVEAIKILSFTRE